MARKLCTLCNTRPVGYGTNGDQQHATTMGYCTPCLTEAEWENTHSDYGHDVDGPEVEPSGEDEVNKRVKGCWECYPELNEAQRPYTPRTRKPATQGTRRTQLNHKTQCKHAQTPAARRACREAYWAADSSTTKDEAPAAPAKRTRKGKGPMAGKAYDACDWAGHEDAMEEHGMCPVCQ